MNRLLPYRMPKAERNALSDPCTILISEADGFSAAAVSLLSQVGQVRLENLDRRSLLDEVGCAEVLWVRLRHQIDREVLDAAKRLKMIATTTTGLNHIDLEAAEEMGIRVLSLRGEVDFLKDIRATAELTLGLMLALLRRIPQATSHVCQGLWNRDDFRGHELYGATVGVVGYGRLGKIVARTLAAFDVRVLVADSLFDDKQRPADVQSVPLDQLLKESDIVTLHVNLTQENYGFFGATQFASMKPKSWFINTSRGELVDERSLEAALLNKHLAGAALDVLANEQSTGMNGHPLVAYARNHDNLLITPHIGGCTFESMEKTEVFLANRFCESWRAGLGDQKQ